VTAKNTELAYSKAIKSFQLFCCSRGVTIATSEDVKDYLLHLDLTGKKLTTIELHRSAICNYFGGVANGGNPALSSNVQAVIRSLKNRCKQQNTLPEQARPILLSDLRQMVAACSDSIGGKRDRAILLIGWFAALRRSEVASLNVSSLAFRDDALVVTLGQTKTDQAGQGYKLVLPVLKDQAIDPSSTVRAWLSASGIAEGPLFVRVDRWGHVGRDRIDDEHVDNLVKRLAKATKLEESDYRRISAHGLRAGFVTECAKQGLSYSQIRHVTRHKVNNNIWLYDRREKEQLTVDATVADILAFASVGGPS